MAEERLIDDDKDRKYKIRINENGEEELIISEPEEDEDEIPVFAMPDYAEDDEEAVMLTPEQLAERERIKEEEERFRKEKLTALMQSAKDKLAAGDFEGAKYAAVQAEEFTENNGELYCLKFKILTRNLNEFLNLEECAEVADGIKEHAGDSLKAELKEMSGKLSELVSEAEKKTEALHKENEAGKEERRDTFLKLRTKSLADLLLSGIPFAALFVMTIVFSTFMFSSENGAYLIATIVLGVLAVIAFICTVVAAKKFWAAARDFKLNEKDTSTKIGREYLENKTKLDLLNRIYSAFDL